MNRTFIRLTAAVASLGLVTSAAAMNLSVEGSTDNAAAVEMHNVKMEMRAKAQLKAKAETKPGKTPLRQIIKRVTKRTLKQTAKTQQMMRRDSKGRIEFKDKVHVKAGSSASSASTASSSSSSSSSSTSSTSSSH